MFNLRQSSVLIVAICLLATSVSASIVHVPGNKPTIQAAIDFAQNFDTVVVADGHYYERLVVMNKAIIVGSAYVLDRQTSHITSTIVDADPSVLGHSDSGSVVRFIVTNQGECGIVGLTLQNGTGTPFNLPSGESSVGGGGVYCLLGYPLIDRVRIISCTGDHGSGILAALGSSPLISFSSIAGSVASIDASTLILRDSSAAGELEVVGAAATVQSNCTLDSIHSRAWAIVQVSGSTVAGAVRCQDTSHGEFTNCKIGGAATIRVNTHVAFSGSSVGGVHVDSCLQPDGDVELNSCLITGPSSLRESDLRFSRCTLTEGIDVADAVVVIDSSIVVVSGGSIVTCTGEVMAGVQGYSDDFYGFSGPSWFDCPNIFVSTENIISTDPRFCSPISGDYRIADSSGCAAANNSFRTQLGAFGIGCGCCQGVTGNVNSVGIVDLADLSSLVSFLTGGGYVIRCKAEGNINGLGIVDLADLSSLVSFLTGGGYTFPACN
ncbi:MAG: hypothetical protein WAU88_03640 [Candidatus Zixiibacteriota bacterium]